MYQRAMAKSNGGLYAKAEADGESEGAGVSGRDAALQTPTPSSSALPLPRVWLSFTMEGTHTSRMEPHP